MIENPMKMSHDALCAHRDKEWAHSKQDSEVMQQLCEAMRQCSPEEYRQHLVGQLTDRRKG